MRRSIGDDLIQANLVLLKHVNLVTGNFKESRNIIEILPAAWAC